MALAAVLAATTGAVAPAPARADDAPGGSGLVDGYSASRLVEEARELERETVADPAKDRERWEAVRARTTSFLDRFPDDPAHEVMALLHAVSALRLGRAEEAIRDASLFLDRHGDGASAAAGLYVRGLARAEQGGAEADAGALADLDRAIEAAGSDDFAAKVRYARIQVRIRSGDVAGAVAELRALVEGRPQGTPLARRAERDLAEQVGVGGAPPALPELATAEAARSTVVVVLRRAGEPVGEAALAEARAAAAAAGGGATTPAPEVVDLVVDGFADPRVSAFRAPALPRVYVLGARGRLWVIRAAGVRGAAIGAAVAER
jgi:hypothetical protein